jgi:hypothetical protein
MMVLAALFVVAVRAAEPPPPLPNPNFIVLMDHLDEINDKDYYCADVTGDIVTAGVALQAHTCKEPNNDELFETNAPMEGMIYISDHRLCLAMGPKASHLVVAADCDPKDSAQYWVSSEGGKIHPQSDTSSCWTVGSEPGVESGAGGDHKNKTLTIEPCADHDDIYNSFHMGRSFVGPPPLP